MPRRRRSRRTNASSVLVEGSFRIIGETLACALRIGIHGLGLALVLLGRMLLVLGELLLGKRSWQEDIASVGGVLQHRQVRVPASTADESLTEEEDLAKQADDELLAKIHDETRKEAAIRALMKSSIRASRPEAEILVGRIGIDEIIGPDTEKVSESERS